MQRYAEGFTVGFELFWASLLSIATLHLLQFQAEVFSCLRRIFFLPSQIGSIFFAPSIYGARRDVPSTVCIELSEEKVRVAKSPCTRMQERILVLGR